MRYAFIILCIAAMATPLQAETYSPAHTKVQDYFKSEEEPSVKDALWTTERILKIGMFDTGSPRDGYAEYACQVLYEHGFKGRRVWVQIVDIVKLTRKGKWERIGEARCQ